MNNSHSKSITYIGLCASLLTGSYLIDGIGALSFTLLACICLAISMVFLATLKWKTPLLMTITKRISKIKVWHIIVFFALYRIGLSSLQNEHVWLGIASIYTGYIILAWVTGKLLGEQFLRPLFDRMNIFQPSTELPKDI